ncbi:MAG: hypothetical protein [Malazfec virus 2]
MPASGMRRTKRIASPAGLFNMSPDMGFALKGRYMNISCSYEGTLVTGYGHALRALVL